MLAHRKQEFGREGVGERNGETPVGSRVMVPRRFDALTLIPKVRKLGGREVSANRYHSCSPAYPNRFGGWPRVPV